LQDVEDLLVKALSQVGAEGGHQGQTSFFAFTVTTNGGGCQLIDPTACEVTGSLEGSLSTLGLEEESIKTLWNAFFDGQVNDVKFPTGQGPDTPTALIDTPAGKVILLRSMFCCIQKKYDCFKHRRNLEELLLHLYQVWRDANLDPNGEERVAVHDLLCWGSNQQTVLLIKALWMALGFPLLAPVEGLARLHCSNLALQKECDPIPPGLAKKNFTFFIGIQGELDEDARAKIAMVALQNQEIASQMTELSLRDLFPELCKALKIDVSTLAGTEIFHTPPDTKRKKKNHPSLSGLKKFTKAVQAQKLVKLLHRYENQIKFLSKHLESSSLTAKHNESNKWHAILGDLSLPEFFPAKKRASVVIFAILLAPFHVRFDGVYCNSPYETLYNFLAANGARESTDAIWWIPDQRAVDFNKEISCGWLVDFHKGVLTPLVKEMATCLHAVSSNRTIVFEYFLKIWLHSYLRELLNWKGLRIPSGALPNLFRKALEYDLFTEDGNRLKSYNSLVVSVTRAASSLRQSQEKDLECNLYGVVTFTFLHLAQTGELQHCVKSFDTSTDSPPDAEQCKEYLKNSCPLFLARETNGEIIKNGSRTWSLFQITSWLLGDTGNENSIRRLGKTLKLWRKADNSTLLDFLSNGSHYDPNANNKVVPTLPKLLDLVRVANKKELGTQRKKQEFPEFPDTEDESSKEVPEDGPDDVTEDESSKELPEDGSDGVTGDEESSEGSGAADVPEDERMLPICKRVNKFTYLLSEEPAEDSYIPPTTWNTGASDIEIYIPHVDEEKEDLIVNIPPSAMEELETWGKNNSGGQPVKLCDLSNFCQADNQASVLAPNDVLTPTGPIPAFLRKLGNHLSKVEGKEQEYGEFVCRKYGVLTYEENKDHKKNSASHSHETSGGETPGFVGVLPLYKTGCGIYLQTISRGSTGKESIQPQFFYIPYGFMYLVPAKQYRGGVIPLCSGKIFHCAFAKKEVNGSHPQLGLVLSKCLPLPETRPWTLENIKDGLEKQRNRYKEETKEFAEKVEYVVARDANYTPPKEDTFTPQVVQEEPQKFPYPTFYIPFLDCQILAHAVAFIYQPSFFSDKNREMLATLGWECKGFPFRELDTLDVTKVENVYSKTEPLEPLHSYLSKKSYITANPSNTQDLDYSLMSLLCHVGTALTEKVYPLAPTRLLPTEAQLWSHPIQNGEEPYVPDEGNPYFVWINPTTLPYPWGEQGYKTFHCFIPLSSKGCTVTLGIPTEDTLKLLEETKPPNKKQTRMVLLNSERRGILSCHVSVHVPYGSAFVIDRRQFTGWVDVREKSPTLVGTFSSEPISLNEHKLPQPGYLRKYLLYPACVYNNKEERSEQILKTEEIRKSYYEELKKQIEDIQRQEPDNPPETSEKPNPIVSLVHDPDDERFKDAFQVYLSVEIRGYSQTVEASQHLTAITWFTEVAPIVKVYHSDTTLSRHRHVDIDVHRDCHYHTDLTFAVARSDSYEFKEACEGAYLPEHPGTPSEHPPIKDYTQIVGHLTKIGEKKTDNSLHWSPTTVATAPDDFIIWLQWAARLLGARILSNSIDKEDCPDNPTKEKELKEALRLTAESDHINFSHCEVILCRIPIPTPDPYPHLPSEPLGTLPLSRPGKERTLQAALFVNLKCQEEGGATVSPLNKKRKASTPTKKSNQKKHKASTPTKKSNQKKRRFTKSPIFDEEDYWSHNIFPPVGTNVESSSTPSELDQQSFLKSESAYFLLVYMSI